MTEFARRFLIPVVLSCTSIAVQAAMLKIPISLRGGLPPGTKSLAAECVLTPVGDHDASLTKMSAPLQVPGLGGFDLPPGNWMVELVVPGYWHPPRVVQLKDGEQTADFQLWPTATIRGVVKVNKGEPIPEELLVRFQSPPSVAAADRVPITQIKCPIRGGRWTCEVPAGLLDLRFRARHFLSEFRWAFRTAPAQVVDLGTFTLRRGSSVIGVVQPPPQGAISGARVIVQPRSYGAPAGDGGRESMRVLAAAANERGFFSIEGIPPGEYMIVAQQKNLSSIPQPVRVLQDAEIELLEPLVLYPPRSLALHVAPETDPAGASWRVRLFAEAGPGGRVDLIADDSLSRTGDWKQEGLRGSRYVVNIRSANGANWLHETIELPDLSNAISLQIPIVDVRGTVKLGDRPIEARIHFGGESGAVSIPLQSDAKGNFRGMLPKQVSSWGEVTVVGSLPNVKRTLRDVKVTPRGDGTADVDLVLPSTYISGSVVDDRGHPVAHAIVNVQNAAHEPLIQVFTEDDGTFEINGLAPGRATLQASAYLQESDSADVILADSQTAQIKLVMKSTALLSGRVVSSVGPVPGARVIAVPTDVTSLAAVPVTTNAAGEFACPIAGGARQLDFSVEAPGFAYKMFHLMVPDKSIDVPLDQSGGTLVVEVPPFDGDDPATMPFLIHAGARRALPYIGRPAFQKTDRGYRIQPAMLERGEYTVCIGTSERCVGGFLPPLGQLSLTVP